MSQLPTIFNRLYTAFEHVPQPQQIDICTCCVPDEEIEVLLSKSLRGLSPNDLSSYASSVTLTGGSVDDLRYFLPRILEIAATDSGWWPSVEVVFASLQNAEWQRWNAAEVAAITDFAEAFFACLLAQTKHSGDAIDEWICAFGRAKLDLEPFLNQLQAPTVRHKLIEYYEINSTTLLKGKLSNSFWDDAPEAKQTVVAWFRSPEIEQAIWEAYGLGS